MTVTGMEPTKTPGTVFANSWFDLGFAFVILGLLVTGIGVVLHFRREVQPRRARRRGAPQPHRGGALAVSHARSRSR